MIPRIIFLSVIFSCFLFSQQYDQYEDVVYLKDGSIIRGMVIEQVPNDYLKIKSGSNVFVYQISDIEKITKELRVVDTVSYKNTYNSSKNYSYTSSSKGREGFIIGFSYGRQSTEIDLSILSNYDYNSYMSTSGDDEGSATDFKIGFAPSSSLAIYYTNKVAWYNGDVSLSHTGIGATFFLNSSNVDRWKQSAFITASIGRSELDSNLYGSYDDSMDGTGYSFGVGVEPAKNLMIEMVWCFARIEENSYSNSFSNYNIEYEWDMSVFSVTVGLLSL